MFVDVVSIKVKAGNGGDGAVSFHRDKFTSTGGPDGGNGGRGGSVIFEADSNLSTLSNFRYKKKFFAQNGQNGSSGKKSGKSGENLFVKVPFGTLIKDEESGKIIADISTDEPFILAQGGRGGAGNMNFAGPVKQSPRFSKPGEKGLEIDVKLELKLLADVGLVGYPNVGKSTIISAVSEAKPQIANYHFTTISPILGVVKYSDELSFVMADIPGLIEGAWEGTGLGHRFLRHVERCRLLLHVVDLSGSEGRDPCKDFDIINEELKKFSLELSKRPMLVVGNKCDIASDEQIQKFKNYVVKKGYDFIPVSAASNKGIKEMLDRIANKLSSLPPAHLFMPELSYKNIAVSDDKLEIKNENGVFVAKAAWLDKLVESVNFEDYDSMRYFQDFIVKEGLMDALKSAGAKEGDTVKIGDIEFDFFD
jgi:GTP-binding protein